MISFHLAAISHLLLQHRQASLEFSHNTKRQKQQNKSYHLHAGDSETAVICESESYEDRALNITTKGEDGVPICRAHTCSLWEAFLCLVFAFFSTVCVKVSFSQHDASCLRRFIVLLFLSFTWGVRVYGYQKEKQNENIILLSFKRKKVYWKYLILGGRKGGVFCTFFSLGNSIAILFYNHGIIEAI